MYRGETGRKAKGERRKSMKGFLAPFAFRLSPFALVLTFALNTACYQKMSQQPKYDPLEPSQFWADGMSARPRIPGTVARGELHVNPYFETGMIDGQPGEGLPFPVTEAVVDRGEDRYDIYCSQCHGRTGDGNGMIPARGYSQARSFHTEAMRIAKAGHFFDVVTNGFGAMPPYRIIRVTRSGCRARTSFARSATSTTRSRRCCG